MTRAQGLTFLSLAVDSFGAVWLAGGAPGSAMRRLDGAGAMETVPSPCRNYTTDPFIVQDLGNVATSPTGVVWFTEPRHATIGRLDPETRAISCYHAFGISTSSGIPSYPNRLAPTSSGAVWFLETLYSPGRSLFPGGMRTFAIGRLVP